MASCGTSRSSRVRRQPPPLIAAYRVDRLQTGTTREDRKTGEEVLLCGREQQVRPVDRRGETLLSIGSGARLTDQQPLVVKPARRRIHGAGCQARAVVSEVRRLLGGERVSPSCRAGAVL